MPRGSRPGERRGGRQAGTKNKRTKELERATAVAAEAIADAIPEAFAGDAHAFLMTVYKDPSHPLPVRLDAAGKAIRFEKPALAQIEQTLDGDMTHRVISADPLSSEDWEAR